MAVRVSLRAMWSSTWLMLSLTFLVFLCLLGTLTDWKAFWKALEDLSILGEVLLMSSSYPPALER